MGIHHEDVLGCEGYAADLQSEIFLFHAQYSIGFFGSPFALGTSIFESMDGTRMGVSSVLLTIAMLLMVKHCLK